MNRMPYAVWWIGKYAATRFAVGAIIAGVIAFFDVSRVPPFWLTAPILGFALAGYASINALISQLIHRADTFGRSKRRGLDELAPALWVLSEALQFMGAILENRARTGEASLVEPHITAIRDEIKRFHETLRMIDDRRRENHVDRAA